MMEDIIVGGIYWEAYAGQYVEVCGGGPPDLFVVKALTDPQNSVWGRPNGETYRAGPKSLKPHKGDLWWWDGAVLLKHGGSGWCMTDVLVGEGPKHGGGSIVPYDPKAHTLEPPTGDDLDKFGAMLDTRRRGETDDEFRSKILDEMGVVMCVDRHGATDVEKCEAAMGVERRDAAPASGIIRPEDLKLAYDSEKLKALSEPIKDGLRKVMVYLQPIDVQCNVTVAEDKPTKRDLDQFRKFVHVGQVWCDRRSLGGVTTAPHPNITITKIVGGDEIHYDGGWLPIAVLKEHWVNVSDLVNYHDPEPPARVCFDCSRPINPVDSYTQGDRRRWCPACWEKRQAEATGADFRSLMSHAVVGAGEVADSIHKTVEALEKRIIESMAIPAHLFTGDTPTPRCRYPMVIKAVPEIAGGCPAPSYIGDESNARHHHWRAIIAPAEERRLIKLAMSRLRAIPLCNLSGHPVVLQLNTKTLRLEFVCETCST